MNVHVYFDKKLEYTDLLGTCKVMFANKMPTDLNGHLISETTLTSCQ